MGKLKTKSVLLLAAVLGAGLLLSPCDGMAISVNDVTSRSAGVNVTDVVNGVNIKSDARNNVIKWSSYNVAQTQTVQYDLNNYLNLIGGNDPSKIDGKIMGDGNIYLINPNGVIFGDNSSVNVGNLYVSTSPLDQGAVKAFETSGADPLANSATKALGDIVNLGNMCAERVYLEGDNVVLKNGADLKSPVGAVLNGDNVIIRAQGDIEVGHKMSEAIVSSTWNTNNKNAKDYLLISTLEELRGIQNKPNANYMLANDIDAGRVSLDVIAGTYYGSFNGLYHKISNLNIDDEHRSHVGLFGNLGSTGVVKNLTLVDCDIRGVEDVGAFAGYMDAGSRIDNCHTEGGNIQGTEFVGGIAGTVKGGMITNSDNSAAVNGWNCVGGIVGIADTGPVELDNCHNYGNVVCNDDPTHSHYSHDWRYENAHTGGLIGYVSGNGLVTGCSNAGVVQGTTDVGGLIGSCVGDVIDNIIIKDSVNNANVQGQNNMGGLIGMLISFEESGLVLSNVNRGDVAGTDSIGGLIGKHICGTVQGNINYGKVSGAFSTGGIVGDTFDDSIYDYNISYANQPGVPTDSIVNEMISEAVDKIYHGAEVIGLNRVLKVFSVAEDYQRLNLDTILLQPGLNINLAGQVIAGNTLPLVQFKKDEE